MVKDALWIWESREPKPDEYADFSDIFSAAAGQSVQLRISADSNYAVWVNGQLAAFGQYADYPHCKVIDTHDITRFCRDGRNELTITVWYYGVASFTYCPGKAGLLYTVTADGAPAAASGIHTLCRRNPHYASHRQKLITSQLGFSFFYDAAGTDTSWHPAVETGFCPALHRRPILPLELWDTVPGTVIGGNGSNRFLLDLGQEEAGFLELELESGECQNIRIDFGEHLVDGHVPRIIGYRDFSVEYAAVPGENRYLNPFRRLGCRYLELVCEKPIRLRGAGIRPTIYPLTVLPFDPGSPRRKQIYDTAVRTLRLCMHEHYEDCPWREQALYTMDSRNQMLCGYYAFGETRFPRANLWLMAQDRRDDGLLSICFPTDKPNAIPSFSLHWYRQVLEYTQFSGDLTLVRDIWHKLCSVLDGLYHFFDPGTGLLPCLPDDTYWNFYEWTDPLLTGGMAPGKPDLILNCLFLEALEAMDLLSGMTGLSCELCTMAPALREAIRSTFRREDGLFWTDPGKTLVSQLGCALAVLTGVATDGDARAICRVLAGEVPAEAVPVSLSMTAFVYDALLQTDRERYASWVLRDIDGRCGYMLDRGATTFWETMEGWQAFENAGSLCHGWSALAVYYYHKLL